VKYIIGVLTVSSSQSVSFVSVTMPFMTLSNIIISYLRFIVLPLRKKTVDALRHWQLLIFTSVNNQVCAGLIPVLLQYLFKHFQIFCCYL